jgi:hypothetical protein
MTDDRQGRSEEGVQRAKGAICPGPQSNGGGLKLRETF